MFVTIKVDVTSSGCIAKTKSDFMNKKKTTSNARKGCKV